jgi:serine/alanine adding enzyme
MGKLQETLLKTMEINTRIAQYHDKQLWEQYLNGSSYAHHANCWQWREILSNSFQHTPLYIVASSKVDNKEIVTGILPLFFVKSIFFGKALISMPYLNGGGIITDCKQTYTTLINHANVLGQEYGVKYIELRHRAPLLVNHLSMHTKQHKASMVLKLPKDPDELFNSFPSKLRSQIRRPIKEGLEIKTSGREISKDESLDAFYKVFSSHMRNLGTPVYPRSLFKNTMEYFKAESQIHSVWKNNKPIACAFTIGHKTSLEVPWAASLFEYKHLSPNMLLYWSIIKNTIISGYDVFDFGRSSYDSGSYNFKKQWGASELPLYWHYLSSKNYIPEISPNNKNFKPLVQCWKFLPTAFTNTLGPWLTRSLP